MVRVTSWLSSALLLAAGFTSIVLAIPSNYNPTGAGCVDPKGFLSCFEEASNDASSCAEGCTTRGPKGNDVKGPQETDVSSDCLNTCSGFWYASNVGCWLQSCWNQVYSCEYQLTGADYFAGTGLVQGRQVPHYPPPPGATGGECSCNLGYVYGNITYDTLTNCISSVGEGLLDPCRCCQFSMAVSNVLNACPKSDLSLFNFQREIDSKVDLLGDSASKCSNLDENPGACVSQFGYEYYGDKIRNPLNIPKGEPGTEPLSNLPGDAFTEAGEGLLTLSLFPGYLRTLTPAPFVAEAERTAISSGAVVDKTGGGESGSAKETGKGAAAGTGSLTGTAASPSKTSGGIRVKGFQGGRLAKFVFVAFGTVLLC